MSSAAAATLGDSGRQPEVDPKYFSRLSDVRWTEQDGGRFKESSTDDFPASAIMSGILVELAPGGMREPHWHDPNEWAYVIKGTCRVTVVEQGSSHGVDSWDFQAGDIWYFPSNLGHIIVGLPGKRNCTFIAGYDQGDFRETKNARGVSGWLSTAPADIVAQARPTASMPIVVEAVSLENTLFFGGRLFFSRCRCRHADAASRLAQAAMLCCRRLRMSHRLWPACKLVSDIMTNARPLYAAEGLGLSPEDVAAHIKKNKNHFLAAGDVAALMAGQSDPPLLAGKAGSLQPQASPYFHRLPLASGVKAKVDTAAGTITVVDRTLLPVATGISGGLVHILPRGLRQLHWHPLHDEWQFVINGTMQCGIYNGPGQLSKFGISTGDVGFAPRGSGHWILNTSETEDLWLVLIFNSGTFSNVEVTEWLGAGPPQYAATALNTSLAFPKSWDYSKAGLVPPVTSVS